MPELKRDETGAYVIGIETRFGKRWLPTGETSRSEALRLMKGAHVEKLAAADKVNALTAETLSAIIAGKRVTCGDLAREWADWRRNDGGSDRSVVALAVWIEVFFRRYNLVEKPVSFVTADMVREFVNAEDAGKRTTRAAKLSALRSLFKLATARNYRVGNPALEVHRLNHRTMTQEERFVAERVPFTEKEFRILFSHTEGFWRSATAFGWWAGMRISDIALLEWSSIRKNDIRITTEKSDYPIYLPVDHEMTGKGALRLVFLDLMPNGSRYVFPEEAELMKHPTRRANLSVTFKRLAEKHGIYGKSFHCFRHAFASRLRAAGVELEDIAKVVGHRNKRTTEGYTH